MKYSVSKRFFAIVGSAFLGLSTPAISETLADALISGYENSGLLAQNRAVLRAADEDVALAVASLRPTLSYIATASRSPNALNSFGDTSTADLRVSLDWLLYDFGRSDLRQLIAMETVLMTRDALVGVEQQVLLSVVSAYMSVQRDREFVALRQNNVRLITQELRASRDRFNVGDVTRTDVSAAEARLALSRARLAASQGALAASREAYLAAVGHYPSNLAQPPVAPALASSVEEAREIALRTHPDILQAQRAVTVRELGYQQAQASRRPTLNLSAQAGINHRGTDTRSATVTLSGPIYQGGQIASAERQAVANRDAARANLYVVGQNVTRSIGTAWADLAVARAQIEASRRQIRAARTAFEGFREEATLGARTTLDVLNAEQELLDAEANLLSAQSDAQIAAYAVLSSMGLLTASHLGLGIQEYDPSDYYNAVRLAPHGQISEQGQRLDSVLERLGR
ncbi:TolC family outer membrane protein [Cochlodiniinecator piscidefendens]|uniref:TolC family outer membrane protein n=1 Tax=Cochlodiniinecator piscidefendens TaxID=2715756 RepID=UPI0014093104|nr:TolC family outer membrane protein [Cochlodiniinecator piscidefendens]